MILSKTTALLFSSHLVILFVKAWFLFHLSLLFDVAQAPKEHKFMLLFEKLDMGLLIIAIGTLINEFHYLSTFFYRAIPHSYKYFEIVGIIYIMIFIVSKLKKETI